MNSPPLIYRENPNLARSDQTANGSPKLNRYRTMWSVIVKEARAFFLRPSHNTCPACASPSAVTISDINQTSRTFTAKECFKRCDDIIIFNDQLYKWRDWFNVPPTLIALRDISSGEEVVSDPSDLENSDVMIHWGLTYSREEN